MSVQHFVAVEGCIASGKTTLATRIATDFGLLLLLENYDEVPSLKAFYNDPDKYAFQTEIEFTKAHFNQLLRVSQTHHSAHIVTDFTLERDLMFASITMAQQPENLSKYREFWLKLVNQIPSPNYILVLEAPVEELLRRIRARGRPFEQTISSAYLEQLISGFRSVYGSYEKAAVEFLDSTGLSRPLSDIPVIGGRLLKISSKCSSPQEGG